MFPSCVGSEVRGGLLSAFFASNSISKFLIFLSNISSSTGFEMVFSFTEDKASSIKSIALSGNFLSLIYLILKSTAETIAPSVIFIQWCVSYFSFIHLRIAKASSRFGSSIKTCANLLSKAGSFSIYFLYSLIVVAQIKCKAHLAKLGFNKFQASACHS
jgi:hypothetical protein